MQPQLDILNGKGYFRLKVKNMLHEIIESLGCFYSRDYFVIRLLYINFLFLADHEAIRNDFLLLETFLFDFLNTFIRPIEVIQMNQSFANHIENRTGTINLISGGISWNLLF